MKVHGYIVKCSLYIVWIKVSPSKIVKMHCLNFSYWKKLSCKTLNAFLK